MVANQYFSEKLGWAPSLLIGQDISTVFTSATRLFCESYVIPTVFKDGRCCEIAVSLTSTDGTAFPKIASIRQTPDGDHVWIFLEAEKRNRLFQELESARSAVQEQRELLDCMAHTDDLTGLANRRDLEVSARRVFLEAQRSCTPVAVLMMDIDHFKSINDTYGHEFGDKALCGLADALTLSCRKTDIVARLGGDEFVCVLNNTEIDDALELCDRIHESVAEIMLGLCRFTVSIGLAILPCGSKLAFSEVLKLADQGLYKAKDAGRNATQIAGMRAA